jgi:RND family efflux transporter MFP subunit
MRVILSASLITGLLFLPTQISEPEMDLSSLPLPSLYPRMASLSSVSYDDFQSVASSSANVTPIPLPVEPIAAQPATKPQAAVIAMLPGVVTPVDVVTLSVPMDGVIAQIFVEEGTVVTAQQPIAVLDDRVARASMNIAKMQAAQTATLDQAFQQQQKAARFLERIRKSHENKASSGNELDQAQSEYDFASQNLKQAYERKEQAEAQLQLEQARVENHRIQAPFAGRVTRIKAHAGQSMNVGDAILMLVDTRRLKTELHVPADFRNELVVGHEYQLEAEMPISRHIPGRLIASENMIDAATGTFRCVFEIDNPGETLPAGFLVRLVTPSNRNPQSSQNNTEKISVQ